MGVGCLPARGGNIFLKTNQERHEKMQIQFKGVTIDFGYWILLYVPKMTKTELCLESSSVSLAKLGKDEKLAVAVLVEICCALKCNIGDIMDVLPEDEEK